MSDVTRVLSELEAGAPEAAERLLPLVYDELRGLAAAHLAREPSGQTLQPTALVHEAWLRLSAGDEPQRWDSRGHFFAAAAISMRRILVDAARRRRTLKRGGGRRPVDVDLNAVEEPHRRDDLVELDAALEKLSQRDARKGRLVELRFFAGLTMDQAAEALGVSLATAERDWSFARAWLLRELAGE